MMAVAATVFRQDPQQPLFRFAQFDELAVFAELHPLKIKGELRAHNRQERFFGISSSSSSICVCLI